METNSTTKSKPTGACEDLKHHVFDASGAAAIDKFNKSKEAALNYATTNYTGGQDVVDMIIADAEPTWLNDTPEPKVLQDDEPQPPVEPNDGANQNQQLRYQTEVKEYKYQCKIYATKLEQNRDWNKLVLTEHLNSIKQFKDNCNKFFGLLWGWHWDRY